MSLDLIKIYLVIFLVKQSLYFSQEFFDFFFVTIYSEFYCIPNPRGYIALKYMRGIKEQ